MAEDIWDKLVQKYDIHGYTDSLIIVKYETLKELDEKAEKLPIYVKQFRHMTEHALELEDKLKAVKMRIARYEKLVTIPDPADLDLIEDIKKILGVEG